MPEVHVPNLADEEHDDQHDPAVSPATPAAAARPHRRHTPLKLLLEVVLITTGVFLGIAGESWRESREHRELAEQSLRRFRDEFKANRNEVLRVHDRHIKEADDMRAYLKANGPALMAHMADPTKPIPVPVPDNTTDSAVSATPRGTLRWRLSRWPT